MEEKSGFRKLLELSDREIRKELKDDFLYLSKGRADNMLHCLETGAKKINEQADEINTLREENQSLQEKVTHLEDIVAGSEIDIRNLCDEKEQAEAEVGSLRLTLIETLAELQSHNAIMTKLGADKEAMQKVVGKATHLATRIVEEKDFSSPEKAHRLAVELLQALKEDADDGT